MTGVEGGQAPDDRLDRLGTGVLLLDEHGRVVRLNNAAATIVAQQDGLTLVDGALRAVDASQTNTLKGLIVRAVKLGASHGSGPGGTLRIERPSGRRPWSLLVIPLLRHLSPKWHPDAVAAIFFHEIAGRTASSSGGATRRPGPPS